MNRRVDHMIQGFRTIDGAGVNLVRVLSNQTTDVYDPMLMLDSFDSTNPEDYRAGFPLHPHRGIETISYVYNGAMEHRDTLGNSETVHDGEVQYMTAGSGILHEEMIPATGRLLGVQLWLNLPAKDKMTDPAYSSITRDEIPEIVEGNTTVRLLMGNYGEHKGHQSRYLPLDYYDLVMEPGAEIDIPVKDDKSVMLFTLLGSATVEDVEIPEKTAAHLSKGDNVHIIAGDTKAHVLYMSSDALDEPVSWGGPIVMNTDEELEHAFDELQNGTFIKKGLDYEIVED